MGGSSFYLIVMWKKRNNQNCVAAKVSTVPRCGGIVRNYNTLAAFVFMTLSISSLVR